MDDQVGTERDWSNLPNVVLFLVLKCLETLENTDINCHRLRAVCTSWRSSISPPLQFAFRIRPLPNNFVGDGQDFVSLKQRVIYLISLPTESTTASASSYVWLTYVSEKLHPNNPPNIWKLRHPVWGVVANSDQRPKLKAMVNLLDCRISKVATSYHAPFTLKTVMLPNYDNFWLLSLGILRQLFLFNSRTNEWVEITHLYDFADDIIAYDGKFYATNHEAKLIVIDPTSFEVKQIINKYLNEKDRAIHLLESCGRLYIVIFESDHIHNLEINAFSLSYSSSSNKDVSYYWEPVTSLGDRVLVVSSNINFSVSAQDMGWDQGNCILFTVNNIGDIDPDHMFIKKSNFELNYDYCALYAFEDGKIYNADHLPSKFTRTFWPVPSWLDSITTMHY